MLRPMAVRTIISGRVQGVGFRAFTRDAARSRDLRGWVRNRDDGTVEAHVEGPDREIESLLTELGRGPTFGSVSSVETEDVDDTGATGFEIRR
ncbi:acylphosphatase [Palleronia salina]|uniref:Acylphosphatase n=1 Tax=Palleronia salina TaxID=313368 RepID=A0A1M6HJX7_9RHOB|nr:acylphosphatase [Palleronia salina]